MKYLMTQFCIAIKKSFDFRPAAIIERFDLRRPTYLPVSVYGHFGREDLDLPWERLDLKDELLGSTFKTLI